jgi:hypothetical protein
MGEREKREGKKKVHGSLIIASSCTCAAPIERGRRDASNATLRGSFGGGTTPHLVPEGHENRSLASLCRACANKFFLIMFVLIKRLNCNCLLVYYKKKT